MQINLIRFYHQWPYLAFSLVVAHTVTYVLRAGLESTIIGAFLSLSAGSVVALPALSKAMIWILYFYTLYCVIYDALEDTTESRKQRNLSELLSDRWFVILFCGLSISIAVFYSSALIDVENLRSLSEQSVTPTTFLFSLLGPVPIVFVLFGIYLFGYKKVQRTPSQFLELHHDFSDEYFKKATENNDISTKAVRVLAHVGNLIMITFTVAVLSLFTAVLWLFYPIPELVILVSSTFLIVANIAPGNLSKKMGGGKFESIVDVEHPFFRQILSILTSQKGFATIPLIFQGVLLSTIPYLFGLSAISNNDIIGVEVGQPEQIAGYLPNLPFLPELIWFSVLFGLFASGTLGLWYWFRIIQRLPSFLEAWEKADGKELMSDSFDPPEVHTQVRRPPADNLISVFLFTVIMFYVGVRMMIGVRSIDSFYILIYLFSIGLVGWMVWNTLSKSPQPPFSDSEAIPNAMIYQTMGVMLGVSFVMIFRSFMILNVGLIMLAMFLGVYYSADVFKYSDAHDDWRRTLKFTYPIGLSMGILLIGQLLRPFVPSVIFGIAVAGALLTILYALLSWSVIWSWDSSY